MFIRGYRDDLIFCLLNKGNFNVLFDMWIDVGDEILKRYLLEGFKNVFYVLKII